MTRAVPWFAAFVGLVAAAVAAVRWLGHHQPNHYNASGPAAALVATVVVVTIGTARLSARFMGYERTQRNLLLITTAAIPALLAELVSRSLTPLIVVDGLYVLWVVSLTYYNVHAHSHKTCPACAETIKAKARICRYCGRRFASIE